MRSLLARLLLVVCLAAGGVFHYGLSPMAMLGCPGPAGQTAAMNTSDCNPAPMTTDCLAACGLVWADIAVNDATGPGIPPRTWSSSDDDRTGLAPAPPTAPPRT
jgi:hypothetical protein